MAKLASIRYLFALCVGFAALCPSAFAELKQLAMRVPASSNALVVINSKAALSSPLARIQNWNQTGAEAHKAGMIRLPARADYLLMAAEMDFEFLQPLWEIAVAYVPQQLSMASIAKRSGGQLERVAGAEAVERPNDSVVIKLGPKVVGAMAPANRQQVSRWVRESRVRKSPELSKYLTEALGIASKPANHVVLALDLQGVFAPSELSMKLAKEKSILKDQANVESLTALIASLRGVRLEIQLASPAKAKLSLDFDKEAEILAGFAKPLLLNFMAKNGVSINDIQDWKVQAQDTSISFEGNLFESGLRRVLSLLSSPVGPLAAGSSSSTSAEEVVAEVSQWYFQAVTNYLNDLFFGDRQPRSLQELKIWVQRYAHKIEDLDRYQVDNDILLFGQEVTDSLHEIVRELERAETRSDARDSNTYDSGRRRYGRYGAYGYYEKQYATRDRQVTQAIEANRVAQTTRAIVEDLRSLSAQTRQTMVDRYDREF